MEVNLQQIRKNMELHRRMQRERYARESRAECKLEWFVAACVAAVFLMAAIDCFLR